MAVCLLYRRKPQSYHRFYRVEIAMNLFCGVSVLREWGIAGRKGQCVVSLFDNLRDASAAADRHREKALRRGYARTGQTL